MLKIKDNVDLKELEKFGFEKKPCGFGYFQWTIDRHILVEDRVLQHRFPNLALNWEEIEVVKDLIQAGLVEKVGE